MVGGTVVDLRRDRGIHISKLDGSGQLIVSTADLDGAHPIPPSGVLNQARRRGQDRVTWQPSEGVRVAAVVRSWGNPGGTVLVGRSLAPAEHLEAEALPVAVLAWAILILLGVTGVLFLT